MAKTQAQRTKSQNALSVRATISFPVDLYETLEAIAKREKVSLAWVVRAATENYAAEKKYSGEKPNGRRRG
jgi:metal-responsive CopG/Arc/MetJ family transcriptional regulator